MISEALHQLWSELPEGVKLVAISKYHPAAAIEEAYAAGQRLFGENHVQELVAKASVLPKDIEWHFTGHLQTNKVRQVAPFVSLIHGVDSERLLCEIDKQGKRCGRRIPCLLQLHVAKEDTKFGLTPNELETLLASGLPTSLENVEICGLMAMATFTDDMEQVGREFAEARSIFDHVKALHFADNASFKELSMGMSDDYPVALAQGTTMVRVGTKIFGERQY